MRWIVAICVAIGAPIIVISCMRSPRLRRELAIEWLVVFPIMLTLTVLTVVAPWAHTEPGPWQVLIWAAWAFAPVARMERFAHE